MSTFGELENGDYFKLFSWGRGHPWGRVWMKSGPGTALSGNPPGCQFMRVADAEKVVTVIPGEVADWAHCPADSAGSMSVEGQP